MEGQEPYAEEVEELEGGSYDYSIEDSEEDMMSMQGPPQMSMRQQQPVQKSEGVKESGQPVAMQERHGKKGNDKQGWDFRTPRCNR